MSEIKTTSLFLSLTLFLLFPTAALAAQPYNWRELRAGKSTLQSAKKVLGKPLQEYREQLIYENQVLESDDPNAQPVRLNRVILNIGVKGVVESIFLFPVWGTTDEQLRPIFGKGREMTYKKFLSSMGELKVGAGTKPSEKLHYVSLSSPCEVFPKHRVLVLYHRRDVVTGNNLVQIILFY